MKQIKGRVAAITGAGSGIGRALAQALAQEGCHLALSDVDEAGLAETAESLRGINVRVTTHKVDVADRKAVRDFAAAVDAEHGGVHMIFNNAGVSVTDTARDMTDEDLDWILAINLGGVLNGTRAFLPYLEQQEEAHIVNISSILGIVSTPTQSAYCATKFAVRGYSNALRMELAETGIGVTVVHPGGIKTNIARNARVGDANNYGSREDLAKSFDEIAITTPESAAKQIIAAVRKNKARLLIGSDARFLAFMERLFPVSYAKFLARWSARRRQAD